MYGIWTGTLSRKGRKQKVQRRSKKNTANSNELMVKSIRQPTTMSSKTVGGANDFPLTG
uniref:Uncharacterized protein n=1 Tax=Arundo donax TaxID=35708 RepID=A0A0A9F8Z0_ARUDO